MRWPLFVLSLGGMLLSVGCDLTSDKPAPAPAPQQVAPRDPAVLSEEEKLQGTWELIALEEGGQKVADDRVQALRRRYVVAGNTVTMQEGDRPDEVGTLSLDGSTSPRRATVTAAKVSRRGVYEVTGDGLRLCLAEAGDFPTDLTSRAAPRTDLLTFRLVSSPVKMFAVNAEPEKYAGQVVLFDRVVMLAGVTRRGERYELQIANENVVKPDRLTFDASPRMANQLTELGRLPANVVIRLVCRIRKVENRWHAHVLKIELYRKGGGVAKTIVDG